MLLAGVYTCLRLLLDLVLTRLPQSDREAELLLLRHELSVLRRSAKKPRLRIWDRMFIVALAMRLPRSAWNVLIVRRRRYWAGIAPWSAGSGLPTAGEDDQVDPGCPKSVSS
jgi:hypothetical protein